MYDWKKQKFVEDKMDEYLSHDNTTDIASDPAYQQYRSQYLDLGKQMTDYTANMVDSMTGSYGNDYSKLVNQQAYQQYVGAINDLNPQFESVAASKRSAELQQLLNQMSLSRSMTDQGSGVYLPVAEKVTNDLGPWQTLYDLGTLKEEEWNAASDAYKYDDNGNPYKDYTAYLEDELRHAVTPDPETGAIAWHPENSLLIKPGLLKEYMKEKERSAAKDRRATK